MSDPLMLSRWQWALVLLGVFCASVAASQWLLRGQVTRSFDTVLAAQPKVSRPVGGADSKTDNSMLVASESSDREITVVDSGSTDGPAGSSAALVRAEARIAELERDVAALQRQLAQAVSLPDDARHAGLAEEVDGGDAFTPMFGGQADGGDKLADRLQRAGLDAWTAVQIEQERDAWALSRLELIDRATRENWADSEAFAEQMEALEATEPDLRERLGDEAYDRYLYENGRPNRVQIVSIIGGSAAEQSGLAVGDVIVDYAGERIFSIDDLQQGTRGGQRGESVTLMVEREGGQFSTGIVRGPLGVSLRPYREQ